MSRQGYFDLVVVGGGPGGCSAAISAARHGAKVLLIERSAYPRHKVCGEFVSSESLPLLLELLGNEEFDNLQGLAIDQAEISADGQTLTIPVAPPASSISRYTLDYALWKAAVASGVVCRQQTAVTQISGVGPFNVIISGEVSSTGAVIDATGRWSNLNATVELNSPKVLGIKAHFSCPEAKCSVRLYFLPGGYCGVQPLQDRRINVCAMVRADAATTLAQVFAMHPQLLAESRNWRPLMDPIRTSPLIFRKPNASVGGVLRVGDAAGFVDPFTGDGIALALHSGKVAAQHLLPFFKGRCSLQVSEQGYRKAYSQQLLPVFRGSFLLRRIMMSPLIIRRTAFLFMRIPAFANIALKKTRIA